MFTYIGLVKLTPAGRDNLAHTPDYLDKVRKIYRGGGWQAREDLRLHGAVGLPLDRQVSRQRDRVPETFPAEEVEVFTKVFA